MLRRILPISLYLLQKDGRCLAGHDLFLKRVGRAFNTFIEEVSSSSLAIHPPGILHVCSAEGACPVVVHAYHQECGWTVHACSISSMAVCTVFSAMCACCYGCAGGGQLQAQVPGGPYLNHTLCDLVSAALHQ